MQPKTIAPLSTLPTAAAKRVTGASEAQVATPDQVFNQMDAELIRVLEDLVHVLIDKGVIALTDLPPSAQVKLLKRKGFREFVQVNGTTKDYVDTLDDSRFGLMR